VERGGRRYHINLGGDLNDKKKQVIIQPGLRRPPIDRFTPNNQPKKSRSV
jgi:hypothetical protein